MKKTRFIALVLVVALALMGAGYAAWTDKLCVEADVKTGIMDVDFTKIKTTANSKCIKVDKAWIVDNDGYGKDLPKGYWQGDNIITKISNMFPGGRVEQEITLKNLGTIPVKLCKTTVTPTIGNDLKDYMTVTAKYKGQTVALNSLNIELKPGEEATITLIYALSYSAPNDTTEDKCMEYKVCFDFCQDCKTYGGNAIAADGEGELTEVQVQVQESQPANVEAPDDVE